MVTTPECAIDAAQAFMKGWLVETVQSLRDFVEHDETAPRRSVDTARLLGP